MKLLFRRENKEFVEGEKVKLLYNLILFSRAECYFLIILKGALKRHV